MVRTAVSGKERVLAELGIVVAIACVGGGFGLFTEPGTPLSTRLMSAIVVAVVAWAGVRAFAVIGATSARLIGVSAIWGYALAIPLASAGIAWSVLWLAGGTEAALGREFASVWPKALLAGVGFFALFFVIYARSDRAEAALADARANAGAETDAERGAEPPELEAIGVDKAPLHNRLPPGFPPILALSVEDHYVRVIAADRSEMLLMPLAEAIELMPQEAGAQVHRSWWVARGAITGHRRAGRDIRLELSTGLDLPVSRSMVKPLRDAGWL